MTQEAQRIAPHMVADGSRTVSNPKARDLLVFNRRTGIIRQKHIAPKEQRFAGEKETYEPYILTLMPGLNLCSKELFEKLIECNEGFGDWAARKVRKIGKASDFLDIDTEEAVRMVVETSDVQTLRDLLGQETREDVVEALRDEIADLEKRDFEERDKRLKQRRANRRRRRL